MKKLLITAALVFVCRGANAMDGRKEFTSDDMPAIAKDMGASSDLIKLLQTDDDLGGKYNYANARPVLGFCLVKYHAGVKRYVIAHEFRHCEQFERGEKASERDAMIATSEWCKTNSCPVHSLTYIENALKQ